MVSYSSSLSVLAALLSLRLASATTQHCKPLPNSAGWPSAADWQKLNESVYGHLVAPVPPGAVCHQNLPSFNEKSCAALELQWTNSSFHALQPASVDYNDETCLPNSTYPCSADGYPAYVIEACRRSEVQAGIKFAAKTGVRLVIKGTGHDFPGRSSGAGSLSIYTHNIRGLSYWDKDPRAVALGGVGSVRVAAGERMGDIYAFAVKHNITVIGGADPGVGIGGWVSAGGHGPLTAKFGMGADQVIEMEVVTSDGEYRKIDEHCDPELFWAMRGGGGGNYAVILSVTVKAYAVFPGSQYAFAYNTTANSDTFWTMNAYFHSQLPHLSEAGLMGYYYIIPSDVDDKNMSTAGKVIGAWYAPNLSAKQVAAIVAPMEQVIGTTNWGHPVIGGGIPSDIPNVPMLLAQAPPQAVGISARLGSRLLDGKALGADLKKVAAAFKAATPAPWTGLGHLIAGPGTRTPYGGVAGGSNAVLPAWRKTYTHIVLPRSWNPLNETLKKYLTTDLRQNAVPALEALAPDTGNYMAEADPTQPDWKEAFYGEHYSKLLAIKNKYDPDGIFWCKACVGSDQWDVIGWDGSESEGVGQDRIKLCKKS